MESQLLKDKTKLAVAKVKGDQTQDLYVAVTKATLAEEVVPKEKHVRTLKIACSAHAPRQQVDFVIYKLGKRLNNPSWVVALKSLMVFHRLMRECDPSFQEQVLRFCDQSGRHRLLCLDRYADHTSKETWDYSAWIRSYGVFLDERLDAYRGMRFDPESGAHAARQQQQANPYGGPAGASGGPTVGYTNGDAPGSPWHRASQQQQQQAVPNGFLKDCSAADLLDRLPRMQRLMTRMLACVPEGAATTNDLSLTAANWVLRESKAVYRAASEGVINLADKFFEMERSEALRGLELYKDALALHEKLTQYYATMQAIPALRTAIHYPTLQPLPSDFVSTMEEYIQQAPRDGTASPSKKAAAAEVGNTIGSNLVEPEPEPEQQDDDEEEGQHPVGATEAQASPQHKPSSPVKAALMPVIDLLSFDDEPTPEPAAAPAPAPQPKGELDFLADAMPGQQQQQAAAAASDGFEPGAFDGAQQQQQQQQLYGGPPQQQPYSYPSYAPQMTGYAPQMTGYGYAPQMTGYGYVPQMTGAPNSMAIVPVGPMGMNPFMGGGGGYGMGAPSSYGMPPPAPSSNPFNPFNDGPSAGGGSSYVGQRMQDDPLNKLTEELLGSMPKPKASDNAGPQLSLKELKGQASQRAASVSPQPAG